MSLALRWGDETTGGFLYFDAVTNYTQSYTGQVTKHPIDAGGSITDHFFKDNPKFTVSGVMTGADITHGSYLIADEEGRSPTNINKPTRRVDINTGKTSLLGGLLPDSVSQFLSDPTVEVTTEPRRAFDMESIRDQFIDLVSGTKYNENTGQFDSNVQLVKLFEYDGGSLIKARPNLVVTSVSFQETPDTGYLLQFTISFEQVTFAYLKKEDIPKSVGSSTKKSASSVSEKGKTDSTVQEEEVPDDIDPKRNTAHVEEELKAKRAR
jgi:hypothetical protein